MRSGRVVRPLSPDGHGISVLDIEIAAQGLVEDEKARRARQAEVEAYLRGA